MRSPMIFSIVWSVVMGISTLVAPSAWAEEPDPIDRGTLVGDDENVKLLEALERPVSVDFKETPLHDAIDYLEKQSGIPISLDVHALKDVGIEPDVPVTLLLKESSLRSVFDLLYDDIDVCMTIRDGMLIVTSEVEGEYQPFFCTRIYHVEDFMKSGQDWHSLIDMITISIQPTMWDAVGGPGVIVPLSIGDARMLTVNQEYHVHREIATLFSALRMIDRRAAEGKPPSRVLLFGCWSEMTARAKIEKALDEKVTLKLVDTPLENVIDHFRDTTGVNAHLDRQALDDVGLSVDCPITFQAKDIPWKTALRQMLRPHDLTFVIWSGVLTITSPEDGHWNVLGLYPITDLVPAEKDADELIDFITTVVDPTSWDEVGGPGSISEAPRLQNARLLLIQQESISDIKPGIHDEIHALLETLRREVVKPIGTNGPNASIRSEK